MNNETKTQPGTPSAFPQANGSAVGIFNRKMLQILGLPSEAAGIVMDEVESGWRVARERDNYRRALVMLYAAEKASRDHDFGTEDIDRIENAMAAAEMLLAPNVTAHPRE